MQSFAESVNDKSMEKFHSEISGLWQRQVTIDELNAAFGGFYDAGVDLTVLNNYSPRFNSRPSIDENGVLVIAGHYPTEPNQVYFEQSYVYEGLGWKLIGFKINIK